MVKNTYSGKHEKIVAEEFKRKQGYEMIEKGLKNSVIAEKLQFLLGRVRSSLFHHVKGFK